VVRADGVNGHGRNTWDNERLNEVFVRAKAWLEESVPENLRTGGQWASEAGTRVPQAERSRRPVPARSTTFHPSTVADWRTASLVI
jgi:hypothetical protein